MSPLDGETQDVESRVGRGGMKRTDANLHLRLPLVPFVTGWIEETHLVEWPCVLQVRP